MQFVRAFSFIYFVAWILYSVFLFLDWKKGKEKLQSILLLFFVVLYFPWLDSVPLVLSQWIQIPLFISIHIV